MHRQLFPGPGLPKPRKELVELSRIHLEANGLNAKDAAVLEEIDFQLPPLRGRNIRDHFYALGQHTSEPYLSMAKTLATIKLPEMPEEWSTDCSGWTKYYPDGSFEPVEDLDDARLVIFDVETLYKLSSFPVMATAASPDHWFSWLSPVLFQSPPDTLPPPRPKWDKTVPDCHPHELIPLFGKVQGPERIVVGHNVGYDRARVKEEYDLERSSTRWLDTLSLHVAARGMTTGQRPEWLRRRKQKDDEDQVRDALDDFDDGQTVISNEVDTGTPEDVMDATDKLWNDLTSVNSLAEVAKLHCGYKVDKTIRNRFGDESITHASQLFPELQDLLSYCASDVKITHDVYKKVLPMFLESCPHPASFGGMMYMGSSFLPVDRSWNDYLRTAEETYQKLQDNVQSGLRVLAEELRRDGPTKDDPWHSQLDWTPKRARWSDPEWSAVKPNTPKKAAQPEEKSVVADAQQPEFESQNPRWYHEVVNDSYGKMKFEQQLLPLLLQMRFKGYPVVHHRTEGWCFLVPETEIDDLQAVHGDPIDFSGDHNPLPDDMVAFRVVPEGKRKIMKLISSKTAKWIQSKELTSFKPYLLDKVLAVPIAEASSDLQQCAVDLKALGPKSPWASQLDWSDASSRELKERSLLSRVDHSSARVAASGSKVGGSNIDYEEWPKWYHDLTKASAPGEIDLTPRKTLTPLLLRLKWDGYPVLSSKRFKWLYRVPKADFEAERPADGSHPSRYGTIVEWELDPENIKDEDRAMAEDREHLYFRIPHANGEGKNVGNPLARGYVTAIESGKLASAVTGDTNDDVTAKAAQAATQLSVLCSYWTSARERIMDQMAIYQESGQGMILPQVIPMGTVTRRAVESTWLTASNAKKNRVGSELKSMVKAPAGYSLVGADVDSEELWISSVMGDSQFGMHGSTAIGWMTLEGTKSAGTDLHSKTASILGTTRDAAKVFNYSRIYGAGQKHAVQLLLQGDPTLTKEAATQKAIDLYAATKGQKARRLKTLPAAQVSSIWYGGSESFLFNTLEMIALSDRPATPALGCGVTKALSKSHLDGSSTYLPSRINWVVQSSGVDYLHLLIVSMEYLIKKYGIKARYLISVHDEVRYLAKEEDKYRTAAALQIANAWTRALFCFNLGIDDVPQGVTFFSAVDIDHVLRKEVFMPCVTPSNPTEIPPGESLDINQLIAKTNNMDLGPSVGADVPVYEGTTSQPVVLFSDIDSADHYLFLKAQALRTNGAIARRWLNEQSPITDKEGRTIPGSKVAQKAERKARERAVAMGEIPATELDNIFSQAPQSQSRHQPFVVKK